ncbi:MAG: 2,3-bisphosphoglycerate-independent phosphoglycerate mutase [Rubrobacteridae bacterium]|nr:2,3-bisphosphoglycerate-independent phosphoglycerate mutase [Rubrobacteridae bacterium]
MSEKSEKVPKPVVLCVMDGWGINPDIEGNAIKAAKTPNLDRYEIEFSKTEISASGESVGLPDGQMGNSEVGHLNLGAGRVVYQEITRISKAIREKSFFNNKILNNAMQEAKKRNTSVHLMGLLSDGGVHSHMDHLFALIDMAKNNGVESLYIHAFLDGRDVPPQSALTYFKQLEDKLNEAGIGRVATVTGRYYAMDRDNRWDRVEKAYYAMVKGKGREAFSSVQAVEQSYAADVVDEFVEPTIIVDENTKKPLAQIGSNDTLIFFNFRADRAREITRAFIEESFDGFDRGNDPARPHFVCLTQYDAMFKVDVAYPPQELNNILADIISNHGLKQLHTAETEKYAHVTFFFNGGREEPAVGEERVLIPSPKVATYDLKPEMSAYEVADVVVKAINSETFDFIVVNFANGDMVGHTGVFDAAVKAVEVVDECVGRVVEMVRSKGGVIFITSDHGNADKMVDYKHHQPFTAHTTNKVPFYAILEDKVVLREGGILADVAPTILDVMQIEKPKEMTGTSLIK